jgi:hypothetical protein
MHGSYPVNGVAGSRFVSCGETPILFEKLFQIAGSLLDLKEIGCKSVRLVYISPLSARKGRYNNYRPSKSSKFILTQ